MNLSVEYIPVSSINPYDRNARKHTDDDVNAVMESIRRTGFNDPVGVWGPQNIIVEGHGRVLAAKKLGMRTVPCIRLDHLTDEQRREYAILHNRTAELSEWDVSALEAELADLNLDLDFSDILTDSEEESSQPTHEQNQENTQRRVANILNLENGQFPGAGPYDIPVLYPETELPPIREWIGFNYVMSDRDPEGKAVHFFIDDYQFERIWNEPRRYVDVLKRYVCVATPDFSPYGDMPLAAQIWNHYRKHWVGAFWQSQGVTVIPTLRSSADERFNKLWLDGEPYGGIVLMSFMWDVDTGEDELTRYNEVLERLSPKKMFIYGKYDKGLKGTEVEFIQQFTEKRFSK